MAAMASSTASPGLSRSASARALELLRSTATGMPARAPEADRRRTARILTAAVAVRMAVAAAVGLRREDLYRDPALVTAMFRGYCLVSSLVATPILAWVPVDARRGSLAANSSGPGCRQLRRAASPWRCRSSVRRCTDFRQ